MLKATVDQSHNSQVILKCLMHMHFRLVHLPLCILKLLEIQILLQKALSGKWVNKGRISLPELEIRLQATLGMAA